MSCIWRCRDVSLPVAERTHVMGIINVTPDSFSDGGLFLDHAAAIERGVAMAGWGADILDVGGESTRPGAQPVDEAEEIRRVVPVIEALAARVSVPLSVDTMKASVAAAALRAGAAIINDVSALRADPAMASVAAASGAGVVLMHMQGEPRTMQADPRYDDVVAEVSAALAGWAAAAQGAGVAPDRIALDPGIGFGKTVEHNLALLRHLDRLAGLGHPLLVGPSRKSFMGKALDLPVDQRLEATAGAVAWCVAQHVGVVRVHDVREMVRVVRMVEAIRGAGPVQPAGTARPAGPAPDVAVKRDADPAVNRATDLVQVRGLRVFGHHGVHDRERREGQHFVVDLDARLDLAPAGRRDDLSATLDYSALARRAAGIVATERYALIEALAERLAAMVLEDPRVQAVTVRVAKPEALAGLHEVGAAAQHAAHAAVQIERTR